MSARATAPPSTGSASRRASRGRWDAEEQVEAGRSLLAIRPWRSPDPTVLGARRDVMAFNRPPRVARAYQPPTLRVDAPPPPLRRARLPLLAALVPLVMGLSLFAITSSPYLLLMAGPEPDDAAEHVLRRPQQRPQGACRGARPLRAGGRAPGAAARAPPPRGDRRAPRRRARRGRARRPRPAAAVGAVGAPSRRPRTSSTSASASPTSRASSRSASARAATRTCAGSSRSWPRATATCRRCRCARSWRRSGRSGWPATSRPRSRWRAGSSCSSRRCTARATSSSPPRCRRSAPQTWGWLGWLPHTTSAGSPLSGAHVVCGDTAAHELVKRIATLARERREEDATRIGASRRRRRISVVLLVDEDVAPDRTTVDELLDGCAEVDVVAIWLARERRDLPGGCGTIVELGADRAVADVTWAASGQRIAAASADGVVAADRRVRRARARPRARRQRRRRRSRPAALGVAGDPARAARADRRADRRALARRCRIGGAARRHRRHGGGPVRDRPARRRPARARRRDDGIGQERAAADADRLARGQRGARPPRVPARRLQGRRRVQGLPPPAPQRGHGHRPRRARGPPRARLAGGRAQAPRGGPARARARRTCSSSSGATRRPPRRASSSSSTSSRRSPARCRPSSRASSTSPSAAAASACTSCSRRSGPSGAVTDNIRANTELRIALRVAGVAESEDVIDAPDAARLPRSVPGRALARTGPSELTLFQAAYVGGRTSRGRADRGVVVRELRFGVPVEDRVAPRRRRSRDAQAGDAVTDLVVLVDAARAAAELAQVRLPAAPWLPALPDVLAPAAAEQLAGAAAAADASVAFGVVDEPRRQRRAAAVVDLAARRQPARLRRARAPARRRCCARSRRASRRRPRPASCGSTGWTSPGAASPASQALPHCGSIVAGDDEERVVRLLATLRRAIDERGRRFAARGVLTLERVPPRRAGRAARRGSSCSSTPTRASSTATRRSTSARYVDALPRLVADGRAAGVHFVITGDRRMAIPQSIAGIVARRLILRLADEHEMSSLGLDLRDVRGARLPPGRGFLDDGREVQVAVLGDGGSGERQNARAGARSARSSPRATPAPPRRRSSGCRPSSRARRCRAAQRPLRAGARRRRHRPVARRAAARRRPRGDHRLLPQRPHDRAGDDRPLAARGAAGAASCTCSRRAARASLELDLWTSVARGARRLRGARARARRGGLRAQRRGRPRRR